MLWIGLTGPMGSGKSTVSAILRKLGYVAFDADQIAHKALDSAADQVFRTFGESLRDPQGHVDRRALGRLVFSDPARLSQLESIVHPLVRQEIEAEKGRLLRAGQKAAFYDVPLLFEKKMEAQFDHVLVVSAPEDLRRRRLFARSKMSDAEFIERSSHHLPAAQKEAQASFVIHNSGDPEALESEVKRALLFLGLPAATLA